MAVCHFHSHLCGHLALVIDCLQPGLKACITVPLTHSRSFHKAPATAGVVTQLFGLLVKSSMYCFGCMFQSELLPEMLSAEQIKQQLCSSGRVLI